MEAHLRDTRMEEKVLCEEIEKLNVMQQKYYEQRSKVKWIPNMYKNTRVFHLSTLQRKKKNQIDALKLPNGNWVTEVNDIIYCLVNHFNGLFKKDADEDRYQIQLQAENKIDSRSNTNISMVLAKEEVWNTLKRMKILKASGPDGMPAIFYKSCWETIWDEITKTIQHCFASATLPQGLNHTNIVLVPKVKNPTLPSDFRPMALTNIMYKVITKILAQRIRGHLDKLVDKAQSAFIPGRQIIDNIVTARYSILCQIPNLL